MRSESQPAKEGEQDITNLSLRLNTSSRPLKKEKFFKLPFMKSFQALEDKYEILRKTTGEKETARRIDYR
jgi:hypothetical protein